MAAKKRDPSSQSSASQKWSDADIRLAHEALLEHLEETLTVEDDPLLSIRPLMRLFVSSNESYSLRGGLSVREQKALLLHSVSKFGKAHLLRFFSALTQVVKNVLESQVYLPPLSEYDDEEEVPNDPDSNKALFFLKVCSLCLQSYIDGLVVMQKQPCHPSMELAGLLHDSLISLNNRGSDALDTQRSIISLCEAWWLGGLSFRENLIGQCLPILAVMATEDDCKNDLKRLYQMREAVTLIVFSDESSDNLRHLLVRLVSSSSIKLVHGRQLLAFLLQTDPVLSSDIHRAIKAQLPESKDRMNELFGDIYLRSWKESSSPERNLIEDHLHDLVDSVLHIANPTIHSNLVQVLQPFHHLRKTSEGQSALCRLYGPVLWRSLRTANALVRAHAVELLDHVFPLTNPSEEGLKNRQSMDESIRKACQALRHSLNDSDPRVRVAASTATAHVLGTFWNTLPPAEIRTLLNAIVAEHASDSTSAAVRAGALHAVSSLLRQSPDSHAVLRGLLPGLGNLIHDKVEKVRLATVEMLLVLKELPNFKYYKIVPPDHLQARLAAETNPTNSVSKYLTKLVASSYLPQSKPPSVQLERTLKVLEYPAASRTFYANLHLFIPLEGVSKLASMLVTYLATAVDGSLKLKSKQRQAKRRRRGRVDDSDQEEDDDEDLLTAEDTALMSSVAETIDILWGSVEKDLSKDVELQSNWMACIQGTTLTDMLKYFEQVGGATNDIHCYRTCASILRLAGRLPPEAVDGLVPYISLALRQETGNFSTHIALLCMWDMADQVGPALAQSIQGGLEGDSLFDRNDNTGTRRASPRNLSLVVPDMKPVVALSILQELLRGSDPSSIAARQALMQSMVSSEALEQALWLGTRQGERLLDGNSPYVGSVSEPEVDYILQVCEAYGRFVLHKQGLLSSKTNALIPQAEALLKWSSEKVIPALSELPFIDPNISTIVGDSSFAGTPLSPIAVGPSRKRANRQRTPGANNDTPNSTLTPGIVSPGMMISKTVAISLLQSVCLIFAEWLAVGGDGGSSIAVVSSTWCEALDRVNESQRETVLSAFVRLALQLALKCENFVMLKQLVIHCPDTDEGVSLVRDMFSKLASVRGSAAATILAAVINAVLDAVRHLAKGTDEEDDELPTSLRELWPSNVGCARSALAGILSNKQTCYALTKRIVDDFRDNMELPVQTSFFRAKCLWVLADVELCSTAQQTWKMLNQIDLDTFEAENGLRDLMAEVKEVVNQG